MTFGIWILVAVNICGLLLLSWRLYLLHLFLQSSYDRLADVSNERYDDLCFYRNVVEGKLESIEKEIYDVRTELEKENRDLSSHRDVIQESLHSIDRGIGDVHHELMDLNKR